METKGFSPDNPLNGVSPPMLDAAGKPVMPRFRTPQEVRDDHLKRWNADANNRLVRAWVQRMLDNDPPYDQGRMIEAGLGSCANYSAGYGRRAIARKLEPYVQAFNTMPVFLNIVTKFGSLEDRQNWGAQMSAIHKKVLKKWRPLRHRYLEQALYCSSHGVSFAWWPDSLDWRWNVSTTGDMVVDRLAKADTTAFQVVSTERDFKPDEIWENIKFMKEADGEWSLVGTNEEGGQGWNLFMGRETIENAAGKDFFRFNDPEFTAAKIKNLESYRVDDTKVCTCIVSWELETDGTVTQYIVPKKPPVNVGNEQFLFRKLKHFTSMEEGVVTFSMTLGTNGYFHSIRGTGSNIYTTSRRMDILNCRLDDAVNLELSTMVNATEESLRSGDPITFAGPLVFLNEGVSLVADRRSPNFLQTAIPIAQMFRQDYLEQQGAAPTQIVNEGDKAFGDDTSTFSGADVMEYSLWHDSWELLLIQSLRRLHNLAVNGHASQPGGKEAWLFKQMCLDEGIPIEAFEEIDFDSCWASKPIGNGSPQARMYSMEKILSLVGSMDQQGQNNALRMYSASLPGMDTTHSDEFFPRVPNMRPTQEVRNAIFENNILLLGGSATIEPNDNHIIHLTEHVKPMGDIAQKVQMGEMDEADAIRPLYPLYMHAVQHLEAASQDKVLQRQVSQFNQVIHDLGEIITNGQRKLVAREKKAQENAAKGLDPDGNPLPQGQGGPEGDGSVPKNRPLDQLGGLSMGEYTDLIKTQLQIRSADRNEMERAALHNEEMKKLQNEALRNEQNHQTKQRLDLQKLQLNDLKSAVSLTK